MKSSDLLLGVVSQSSHAHRLEQIQEARDTARLAMRKAQLGWIRDKEKKHHVYRVGDLVWLDGRNIKTYHPTAKLASKRHGPFPIKKVPWSTSSFYLTGVPG